MKNLKVGHHTNAADATGVSVFLFDTPARGSYVICGSAPATHELSVMDPENSVNELHGLVLSGGSALGLFAAAGVVDFLVEQNKGVEVPHGVIPIVPAAAVYDLAYKSSRVPTREHAYQACMHAQENNLSSGRIGAGSGATVGKLVGGASPMTAGIGTSFLRLENGIEIAAYVVVNAAGDIYNPTGDIIAGAYSEGDFVNCTHHLMQGRTQQKFLAENTNSTLAVVFTNGAFTKAELKSIAKTASAGIAQVISPVFTCYDGDIVFAVSLGNKPASMLSVGTIAAALIKTAILDAVKTTEVIHEHSHHLSS